MRSRIGLFLAGFMITYAQPVHAKEPPADVRVMSFNIRFGTAKDGENHWDRRRDFLVETVRAFDPDLLGTQETLGFQRDYLAEKLAAYDYLGVGRDDGGDRGEMMALYYKRDRFEKLGGGHFWLSDMPDKVGSKSWDSSLPRMVTWVKLRDRRRDQAQPVAFFNTHFDHQGATARLESAKLLRRQISKLATDCAVIVTGDFNAGEGSPPYLALFGPVDDRPSPIVDTYRTNNPDKRPNEGTFTGFKEDATSGPRIDWIGVSRDWQIRSAAIDRTARDGRTPSDHFPVTAILRRKPAISNAKGNAKQTVESNAGDVLYGGNYEVQSFRNIPYDERDGADPRKHKLDLFTPKGIDGFPVLVFIHGGAWTTGDRKLYGLVGRTFARNGIGTVVISYRLSPAVQHPAHIEDVARAFAWTHEHIAQYGGRPDRIFVSGHSAGGHLASLLASDEKYLKAHGLTLNDIRGVIPISGVYVFRPGRLSERVIGKGQEAADSASTMTHVSGDEPPFLILYAEHDFPGCGQMSRSLCDALQTKGVDAECREIPIRDHITIMVQPMFSDRDVTSQTMLKFIAQHSELELKPRTTEPTVKAPFVYCSAARDQALVVLSLDPQTGSLKKLSRSATPGEPGALATSPDGKFLFAALRSAGKLAGFRIDKSTGALTAINVVEAGADPSQVSVDKSGRYLLAAYYAAGKVSVHRIADDGVLSDRPVQELPTDKNAHMVIPDVTNRFVFVPHTGPNAIFQFRWNEHTGQLSPQAQPKLIRPDQTGPRHLAWHPTKPVAYIDNEQASSVTAYRLRDDGSLEPGQTVSTLPADFRESNSTAEVKVHPSGRFLYVSNRGHDSLAVIQIDDMGTGMSFIATEPTEKTPRSFDIDPSGQFVLAAGESSGRLAISRIDPRSGRLTLLHTEEIGPKLWWVQTLPRK